MIKPKHSFKKREFEIKEEFIDRDEAKKLYRNKLNSNDKAYNVLAFFGVGGIGKSKLRKEICRLHKEENKAAITFYLDLNAADDRNMGSGILKLVDSCDAKLDFKCFEMAYGLYFRKKNPSALYGREKGMVTENTFVGIGLNILGIFDNGITGTAAEIVERSIRAIANRAIDKDVKEELKRFDDYSIAEMEERLPMFFQYDLMSYLEKHQDTKVLIVFDTFEALNENVIEQVHRSRNERWVQEIIEYFYSERFPNLLVMIFGRDEIEWGEDWEPLIDQYKLEEFDGNYSQEYLHEAGIDDPEIIDVIARGSKGFPLLLYLSAETYANMKNAGKEPQVNDFGGSYPEIIERFLYNLDKDAVEVLRLMSIPNYYDTEIFDVLIKAFNISFPITEYEQFNKYSFVNYNEKEDAYYIHDLIRISILEKTPDQLLERAHGLLLKYFADKISADLKTKYVLQMFYHAHKCMSVEKFNDWLVSPISDTFDLTPIKGMERQQKRGEQSILRQIINGIQADFDISDLRIELANIYIDVVHLGGDYNVAVDICEKYLAGHPIDEIYNEKQLLKMRIRKVHHSMFFAPVDELISEAEEIVYGCDSEKYPEEYNELLFLLGGNLGVLSGNFEYASEWLEKSMSFAKENGLEAFVHRTTRKQADILLLKDDYEGAMALVTKTIDKDSTINDMDSRYKIYLMAVLGEIYRKLGDLETAWECFEKVDKKCTENYMPGWQAHSYLAKGMLRCQEKDFAEAAGYFEKALAVYKKIDQKWGIINTKEAMLFLQKVRGGSILKSDLDDCLAFSEKMHYRYNTEYAKKLAAEKQPYLQLFFL